MQLRNRWICNFRTTWISSWFSNPHRTFCSCMLHRFSSMLNLFVRGFWNRAICSQHCTLNCKWLQYCFGLPNSSFANEEFGRPNKPCRCFSKHFSRVWHKRLNVAFVCAFPTRSCLHMHNVTWDDMNIQSFVLPLNSPGWEHDYGPDPNATVYWPWHF